MIIKLKKQRKKSKNYKWNQRKQLNTKVNSYIKSNKNLKILNTKPNLLMFTQILVLFCKKKYMTFQDLANLEIVQRRLHIKINLIIILKKVKKIF